MRIVVPHHGRQISESAVVVEPRAAEPRPESAQRSRAERPPRFNIQRRHVASNVYELTPAADQLFPKGYDDFAAALIDEIKRRRPVDGDLRLQAG